VILSIHWGVPPQWCTPYQGLVADYQAIVAQRAAAAGVGIILGHHAHAPYGMETFTVTDQKEREKAVPVLYSLGNYISHYEYLHGGLDSSSFTLPHYPPSLPENRQSCIADIKLTITDNRLIVERVTIHPAILNRVGEAIEASTEERLRIANRIHQFSLRRGAQTFVEESSVVWKNTNTSTHK
jgi:hypothetical protein